MIKSHFKTCSKLRVAAMEGFKEMAEVSPAVFAEICDNIDEGIAMMDDYMCGNLSDHMDQTLMSNMKLNPAIESLKKLFQEKNPSDPTEFDIMNLISGIISCSIPGACLAWLWTQFRN